MEPTEAEDRRIDDVNQVGVFLGMKAVQPAVIRAGGGSIVDISSIVGLHRVGMRRSATSRPSTLSAA